LLASLECSRLMDNPRKVLQSLAGLFKYHRFKVLRVFTVLRNVSPLKQKGGRAYFARKSKHLHCCIIWPVKGEDFLEVPFREPGTWFARNSQLFLVFSAIYGFPTSPCSQYMPIELMRSANNSLPYKDHLYPITNMQLTNRIFAS